MTEFCPPVTVSREIQAPASEIFAILSDPTQHPTFDGSEMLVQSVTPGRVTQVGDEFTMKMKNDEMGPYEMTNRVVTFEADRRIAWAPRLTAASRPEDQEAIGDPGGWHWGFALAPSSDTSTTVTESFACPVDIEWLREATNDGHNWTDAMTASLERLDKLVAN